MIGFATSWRNPRQTDLNVPVVLSSFTQSSVEIFELHLNQLYD